MGATVGGSDVCDCLRVMFDDSILSFPEQYAATAVTVALGDDLSSGRSNGHASSSSTTCS